MRLYLIILILALLTIGCQKSKTIGGRVFDVTTGDPIPNAQIIIGTGVSVFTNTSGYYVAQAPESFEGQINIGSLQATAPQGGEALYPTVQNVKNINGDEDYDFYIERNKKLTIKLVDTTPVSGKTYSNLLGYVYTTHQNLKGRPFRLVTQQDVAEENVLFAFAKLGWNYISGYVSTSSDPTEIFYDSIFVSKPLDGLDTITVFF